MKRGSARWIVRVRRTVQAAFLALFVYLVWVAVFAEGDSPLPVVHILFHFDPLILAGTWLASHSIPSQFLLALITIGATLLLGRVFCGWVCPLGTVHHGATWLAERSRKVRARKDSWRPGQRAKYLVLAGLLVMAVFGSHWIGVFDPLSLLYRSIATAVYPGTQYAAEDGFTAVYQADPRVGTMHLTSVTEPAYQYLRDNIFIRKRQAFVGAAGIFAFFVAIVLLNIYRRRFWCRYICPLGALLGTCSKRAALRLVHNDKCTKCGMCSMKCPAGADPDKPGEWRPTECYNCWNCVAACNREAVTFKFNSPFTKPTEAKLDLSKRAVLSAGVAGVGGLVLFRLTPEAQAKTYNPELIRPPGARSEREFLARCLKCGICMRACPTNALHPTGLEAGLEGIWTPQLLPKLGGCEYACNACGHVCPTEAIRPLTLPEKQATKIGLATFDTSRCLPYAYGRQCMVCEEHCPLPKKAIYFFDTEVKLRDGVTVTIKQPHVDPDLCIGCGLCENSCVFKDLPAIRVTSANESRHVKNQAIMPGLPPIDGSDPYGK